MSTIQGSVGSSRLVRRVRHNNTTQYFSFVRDRQVACGAFAGGFLVLQQVQKSASYH